MIFFLQRGNISTKFIENNICRIFERIFQIRISGNRDLCGDLRSAIDDLVIVSSNWCRNWRFNFILNAVFYAYANFKMKSVRVADLKMIGNTIST